MSVSGGFTVRPTLQVAQGKQDLHHADTSVLRGSKSESMIVITLRRVM